MKRTEEAKKPGTTPPAPATARKPAARRKGGRASLGETFLAALHRDFLAHGAGAIERVRLDNPTAYIKLCDALLPKQALSSDERELSDDELDRRIGDLLGQCRNDGLEIAAPQAALGEEAPLRH